MYYEQHYTVTRILKISRNTCYKYLKFVNFNAYIKENKKAHYLDQFKEASMNPERGYEKETVEQVVRFMRRNLLVPLPEFSDFDLYNKELLKRSLKLFKRKHYVLKQPKVDLHFKDINELNQLPPTSFVCTSVSSRKLDNYGRLTTENRHYCYLDPALAYERIQVKYF